MRRVCGYAVMALVAHHILPTADASHVQAGLQSGGMALLAIAYASLQFWFDAQKHKQVTDAVTAAFNADPKKVMIGDEKITDFENRTGIRVQRATAV